MDSLLRYCCRYVSVITLRGLFVTVIVVGVCRLTVAPGPCRAFIPRWSYSMMNGQCERFIYGGCAGNGNNFQSRQQCEDACSNAGGGGNLCI